jgi:hypothetical protein
MQTFPRERCQPSFAWHEMGFPAAPFGAQSPWHFSRREILQQVYFCACQRRGGRLYAQKEQTATLL